jgi:predicted ATP-grasp superfamily ATP-dependent carboligase
MTDNLLAVIPGTGGYLGFDLIGTADDSVEIADINPRLTTGYLGWRMWTRDNIARRLLMAAEPINWLNESGQFRI